MNPEHSEYLKGRCNRLLYGECRTVGCLRRGGYVRGSGVLPSSGIATCIPFEIYNELTRAEEPKEKKV